MEDLKLDQRGPASHGVMSINGVLLWVSWVRVRDSQNLVLVKTQSNLRRSSQDLQCNNLPRIFQLFQSMHINCKLAMSALVMVN